jgi:VanZ family protein
MTLESFFRWIGWLLVCSIAAFTLSPPELRPITAAPVNLERFAAFALLGAAFCLGYPKRWLNVLILLAVVVVILEVAQNIVPGRHGHISDGFVKLSGVCLGVVFAAFVSRYRHMQ